MQLGFTVQSQQNAISADCVKNVMAMTGKGTVLRWMEDASRYYPAPASPDFADLDATVTACEQAGLPVCLPLHNFASSMTTPGTDNCSGKKYVNPHDAAEVATVLAQRYKGRDVWYEDFNEGLSDGNADCDLAYAKDPNGAVAVMRAVYQAIKVVDSSIVVGGPALLKIDRGIAWIEEWLSSLFANGAGEVMDYLALHYYPGTNSALPSLRAIWQTMQGVAIKAGFPQMKLRITEYGFPRGHVTPQQQHDLTLAVLAEIEASGGFITDAYYYTAAENDGYSPYDKSQQYPLYAGFQQFVQQQKGENSVTTLAHFPMVSQRTTVTSDGKPSEDALYDCVPASIGAVMLWLEGKSAWDSTINPDKLKDAAYGDAYTGGTSAAKYVDICKSMGFILSSIDTADPAHTVVLARQLLGENKAVIYTELDPYVDTSLPQYQGWTHVCVFIGDDGSGLTAMDPFIAQPVYKSDAAWASLLRANQVWTVEKISTLPPNWNWDGKYLTCPSGRATLGFAAHILAKLQAGTWDADDYIIGEQYYTKQLEASNPGLGDGDQLKTRKHLLGYPHNPTGGAASLKDTVIEEFVTSELDYYQSLYAQIYDAYQKLKAQPQQPQAPDPRIADYSNRLQQVHSISAIS